MRKLFVLLITALFLSCDSDDAPATCDASSPNRTGAICKDGTSSTSVGSGTCSGHGGVDRWLCN